jgi:hypothetical protein
MSQIIDQPGPVVRFPTKGPFERLFKYLKACETPITPYPTDNRRPFVVQAFNFAPDMAFENDTRQVVRDLTFEQRVVKYADDYCHNFRESGLPALAG